MSDFGLVRVAAAAPPVRIADPAANVDAILAVVRDPDAPDHSFPPADLFVFPELALCGYTCADLLAHETLQAAVRTQLRRLAEEANALLESPVVVVGTPWVARGKLFNCAAVLADGKIVGIVPKRHLPNEREFYERRWFADPETFPDDPHAGIPLFAAPTVFARRGRPGFVLGVELCEDLWTPCPPSGRLALGGATILANCSASPEQVGKADYRRMLVASQAGRCAAAYVYAGAGPTESTTDLVFGGHCLIAENGAMLAESPRCERAGSMAIADLDTARLLAERRRLNSFRAEPGVRIVEFEQAHRPKPRPELKRPVPARPFVPPDGPARHERCAEVFALQTSGLAQRLAAAGIESMAIGVSGGLDSTLALLVAAQTCDLLKLPRAAIRGLTMPGFGTTKESLGRAETLMRELGIAAERIDIRQQCLDAFRSLGHRPFGIPLDGLDADGLHRALAEVAAERRHDLTFENVQARVRTLLLMSRGFVVGTGDLSELALGWCTYNGDHMSMYAVNAGVPKTLVRHLVEWAADARFDGAARATLHAIAAAEVSPELLPVAPGGAPQSTEGTIGPYELHDFFLYHFLRFGDGPAKLLHYARHAKFARTYADAELKQWLRMFLTRFFANQFKRSCLPDGPKVGSAALSPRGDWRMPSDASAAAWLAELDAA